VNPRERVACDTGPILALIDRRDQFHESCAEVLTRIPFPLFTVWPVIVEAHYLLQRYGGPADLVLHWIQAGHVRILDLRGPEIRRLRHLLRKYGDLPMDLADAALVAACEKARIRRVFTTDRRDFLIYRPAHIEHFELIP
jgi:predicted nucleic acid-binding protein